MAEKYITIKGDIQNPVKVPKNPKQNSNSKTKKKPVTKKK